MSCVQCAFYSQLQHNPIGPPCPSCSSDPSDKGYCVAVESQHGYVPIITKIPNEVKALEIIRRGLRNGGRFMLLMWSVETRAYQRIQTRPSPVSLTQPT